MNELLTDSYTAHYHSNVFQSKDLISFLNTTLQCHIGEWDLEGAVLVLASYASYFTYEEFFLTFHIPPSSTSAIINRLIKKGELKRHPLTIYDGTSKQYFSITPSGYARAVSLTDHTLPRYRYTKTIKSAFHIMATGRNFFSALSLGQPIHWEREKDLSPLYNPNFIYKRIENLIADGTLYLSPGRPSQKILFFEQDSGTESDSTLTYKMERYYRYGVLDDPKRILIFSFRRKDIQLSQPRKGSSQGCPFSRKSLTCLVSFLEENELPDIRTLLEKTEDTTHYDLSRSLCKVIGCRSCVNASLKASSPHEECPVTIPFLHDYIKALNKQSNVYAYREISKRQSLLKKERLNRFVQQWRQWITKGGCPTLEYYFYEGGSIYFSVTDLIMNDLRIILPIETGYEDILLKTLDGYYQKSDLSRLLPFSTSIETEDNIFLRFPNCFAHADGIQICFCFLNSDLGAWVRLFKYLSCYIKEHSYFHFILVVDNPQQVLFLHRMAPELQHRLNIGWKKDSFFLIQYDQLGKEGLLIPI